MKFTSRHMRFGIVGIGVILILLGVTKMILKIEVKSRIEDYIVPALFILAIVLLVFMKKFQNLEKAEKKNSAQTPQGRVRKRKKS